MNPSSRTARVLVTALLAGLFVAVDGGSAGAAPAEAIGGGFIPVAPTRVVDTRTSGGCVSLPRDLAVAPNIAARVPGDAAAVALNVTVTDARSSGYLTVYPAGSNRPTASQLNFSARQTVPNAVTVKTGESGQVTLYASGGCPQVVVDIVGYFAPGTTGPGGFAGATPSRVLDTRNGGCVKGVRQLTVAPRAAAGVPADAAAVALNVTVTGPSAGGYLTAFPSGSTRPTASNLSYAKGQTVPNAVTVPVGTGGGISLFASGGCPHVVVDLVGHYTAGTPGAGGFVGTTPRRALDTRSAACVKGSRTLRVTGTGSGAPVDAVAAVMNVTATAPTAPGYLTVFPAGGARPGASSVNYRAGQTVPNAVASGVSPAGDVALFASGGCPHVVVDVVGFYRDAEPPPFVVTPCGSQLREGSYGPVGTSGVAGEWIGIGLGDADGNQRSGIAHLGATGIDSLEYIDDPEIMGITPAPDGNSAVVESGSGTYLWRRGAEPLPLGLPEMALVFSWSGSRLTYVEFDLEAAEIGLSTFTATAPDFVPEPLEIVGSSWPTATSADGRWVLLQSGSSVFDGDAVVLYDAVDHISTVVAGPVLGTSFLPTEVSDDGTRIIYTATTGGTTVTSFWDDGVATPDARLDGQYHQLSETSDEVLIGSETEDGYADFRILDRGTSAEEPLGSDAVWAVGNADLSTGLIATIDDPDEMSVELRVFCR